jgi:hypothetical protein
MQFSTLFVAAALSALSLAAPVEKRTCTVQFPYGVTQVVIDKSAVANTQQTLPFTNIPSNAGGPCSLVAKFPAGYAVHTTNNAPVQVNVIDVDGPAPGAIVGSVNFVAPGAQDSFVTINSFACRPTMTYNLQIAGASGHVDFVEGNGAGVYMTYSC